jgi:hypothetical protein
VNSTFHPKGEANIPLKYIFVAGNIIRTARQTILKLLEGYPYKEVFQ